MERLEASEDGRDNIEMKADEKRTLLKRDLWAMGVGAVISGDFFGWQVTVGRGFGSGLVALCFASILYMVLSASVAEVASIKGAGAGPCQFAKACFGRHTAFITGLAESVKCIVVVGVIATGIGSYLGKVTMTSGELAPGWWLGFIAVFTALNILGGDMSKNLQIVITVTACLMLLVFFVGSLAKGVDFETHALGGTGLWESTSIEGVCSVWPFALWFFLGIEELPLATEMTVNPAKTMPRGLSLSFTTLLAIAFANFCISCSIPPGTAGMAASTYPLLLGYQYVFGDTRIVRWCCSMLVTGLIASLHSFIFATGQLIAQMAHDGYFPKWLNCRTQSTKRPFAAIITGSVLTYLIIITLYFATGKDDDRIGAITIAMCLFCTIISYLVQLSCFVWFRVKRPDAERHFHSPFGITGALVGLLLCCVSMGLILSLPTAEKSYLYGIAMAVAILLICTVAREATWKQIANPSESESRSDSPLDLMLIYGVMHHVQPCQQLEIVARRLTYRSSRHITQKTSCVWVADLGMTASEHRPSAAIRHAMSTA